MIAFLLKTLYCSASESGPGPPRDCDFLSMVDGPAAWYGLTMIRELTSDHSYLMRQRRSSTAGHGLEDGLGYMQIYSLVTGVVDRFIPDCSLGRSGHDRAMGCEVTRCGRCVRSP